MKCLAILPPFTDNYSLCEQCGMTIPAGTVVVVDEWDLKSSLSQIQVECAHCGITNILCTDPISNTSKSLKETIKDIIKETMKEEAADPNGAFSPK